MSTDQDMPRALPKARIYEADVVLHISLGLNEREARALLALTAYGTDQFLQTFFEHMGESCLKPHQSGLRTLFAAARRVAMLARADNAREALETETSNFEGARNLLRRAGWKPFRPAGAADWHHRCAGCVKAGAAA